MKNIQNNENNFQRTENETKLMTLEDYFSNFNQPERARAFLDDILVYKIDGDQWAVGGLITLLNTIAEQKSLDDVKNYIAHLRVHLLDWTTKEMPESVTRLPKRANKTN